MEITLKQAKEHIETLIQRCMKMDGKFKEGTSQCSLLENRIKALQIALDCMNEKKLYTDAEYEKALPPILSIQHKCEKAQSKYEKTHRQYKRYIITIESMKIASKYIVDIMEKKV